MPAYLTSALIAPHMQLDCTLRSAVPIDAMYILSGPGRLLALIAGNSYNKVHSPVLWQPITGLQRISEMCTP